MNLIPKLLVLLPCIVIFSGCKSLDIYEEPTVLNTKIARHVTNSDIDKSLTVKLYETEDDYLNDVNVLQTVVIPSNKTYVDVTLKNNTKYYYDLYSDDFMSTNWAEGSDINHSFTTDSKIYAQYIAYNSTASCHRHVILYPDKSESKWVAVGSFTSYGSTWNSLTQQEKNKSIIFRRNLSATYSDGVGTKKLYFGIRFPIVALNAYDIKLYDVSSYAEVDNKYGKVYLNCGGPISAEYLKQKQGTTNYDLRLPITDTMYLYGDSLKYKTLAHTFILVREK